MAGALLLEIRRRTQSALLVIGEANLRSLPVDISITAASLEVRSGEACTAVTLPAEVRVAPSSCRGLRYLPGDGLHLRLQVHTGSDTKLVSPLSERLKPQKSYVFYCQSCGDIIIKERKFLRVLPLPDENWSALVEEWCCHPNPFAGSALHPQKDDCFLGDAFFLLNSGNESHVPGSPLYCAEARHRTSQSAFTLKSKENTRVICKRCKTTLGETVSSETTKYYVTEVIIRPSKESFNTISSLADAWENDIGVHPLTFPSATCLELLLILSLSTTSLPPSLRCMNSFQLLLENWRGTPLLQQSTAALLGGSRISLKPQYEKISSGMGFGICQ
ncbi:E3 ubiquitin-protein ligase E3D isoform X4 [Struthio camelus]|uniref:E3 ubiquitin-protein ligase E3D isoform X4 n=1 Tax=Struthio camelus TaxID=8801 RepID=UPI003603BE6A